MVAELVALKVNVLVTVGRRPLLMQEMRLPQYP